MVGMAVQKRKEIVDLSNWKGRVTDHQGQGGNTSIGTNEHAQKQSKAARSHHALPPHLSNQSQQQQQQPHIRTPQAQITFQTSAEISAAKKARKANKHYHRAGGVRDGEEVDLEEWERIREESLARGPGELVSGNRVSPFLLLLISHVILAEADEGLLDERSRELRKRSNILMSISHPLQRQLVISISEVDNVWPCP